VGLITQLLLWKGTQEVLLRRRLSLVMAAGLMLVLMTFAAFGPVFEKGIAPRLAEAAPAVQVNVNCTSNPETTAVTNNTNKPIKVKKVSSIYKPRPGVEPVPVNRTLKPDKSITFESGQKADSNILTKQYIYENDVGSREGARVFTSVGRFIDKC
jgi:hypothetical protein